MTVRTRLVLTVAGIALLMAIPALYAALQLNRLRDIASGTRNIHAAAYLSMGRLQARLAELDRLQLAHVVQPLPQTAALRDSALTGARRHLTNLAAAGYGDVSLRAGAQLDEIEAAVGRMDALLASNRVEAARAVFDSVKPLFTQSEGLLQEIGAEIDRRSAADLQRAARISTQAFANSLLALVAGLFSAVLLGFWATYTVVAPIERLRRGMAEVADGEFVVPKGLPYDRTDEIGDLSRSFRSMTQHLSELDRMKADFMSIATHELKTPINVIAGYAELIQEGIYGPISDKQQDALTSVQEQSRNLTQLVNQLLDISRMEAGGLKLEMQDVSVVELMDRLRRTFEGLAHRQNIGFAVTVDRSAPARIHGDIDRLRDQVFGNLLSNALKFTPETGEIDVRAFGEYDRLVVEVRDTGPGIAPDLLPHVFDKYFQIGEQARSRGAGLGLTIAHDVVEAHGGEATVISEEGRGTTFRIELPTRRIVMTPERRAAAPTGSGHG